MIAMIEPGTELPYHVVLNDGLCVRLRLAHEADAALLDTGFAALSAGSRYTRFFSGMSKLPDAVRDELLRVDGTNRVAIAALTGPDEPVGVARYARDGSDPSRAELAITVVDSYHRRGAGRALLVALVAHAARQGVSTLTAEMLRSNDGVKRLLTSLGAHTIPNHADPTTIRMELPVLPSAQLVRS